MEPILRMIAEGLAVGDSAVEICRKRLSGLVKKGLLTDSEFRAILSDIDQDVHEKRKEMISSISSEIKKLTSILSIEAENGTFLNHQ